MPVEARGFQFVADSTCKSCEGGGFNICPPRQLKPASSCAQPKGVEITCSYCSDAICSCEGRTIEFSPRSKKGAMATGPAIVMRYSRFPQMLRSPPGNTI